MSDFDKAHTDKWVNTYFQITEKKVTKTQTNGYKYKFVQQIVKRYNSRTLVKV